MKAINFIAKSIYLFLVWADQKTGKYERFRGETAPYCGHGYSGHTGFFTQSSFRESDGGGESKGWFHFYILGVWYSNVDGEDYGFHFPLYRWLRWFYYESKRWFQLLSVKIDYPYGKRTLYIRVIHFRPRLRAYQAGGMTLHIIRLRGFIPVSHSTIGI